MHFWLIFGQGRTTQPKSKVKEEIWQETIYQQTPFDRFYHLNKFHDQSISQTVPIKDDKNADIIKFLFFGHISHVVGPHNPVKRNVTYKYSERTFYWLSYPFYKRQKSFCFGEIDLLAITLFFLMSGKISGAMATTYVPVDPILLGLQADEMS